MTFQCDAELVPSAVMTTTCTNKSRWIPPPEEQDCDIVEGDNDACKGLSAQC